MNLWTSVSVCAAGSLVVQGLWAARPRLEEWFLGMTCTCEFEWRWTPQDQKTKYPDMCLRCGKVRRNGIVINVGKCWDEEKPDSWDALAEPPLSPRPMGEAETAIAQMTDPLNYPPEGLMSSARHNVVIQNLTDYHRNSLSKVSVHPLLGRRRY